MVIAAESAPARQEPAFAQPLQAPRSPHSMLHIAIWLAVGALIGLVAGLLTRGDDDQGVFVNVVVGVVGALAAGWLVAPYFGLHAGDPKVLDFSALPVALVGAIIALALLSVVRSRRRR